MAAFFVLQGCAAAQRGDGSLIVGFPFSGDSATPSGIGSAVGSIASVFGVPGGPLIGTLAAGLLGAIGYGVKKSNKAASLKGHADGWDERERAAGTQAPLPGPVVYAAPAVAPALAVVAPAGPAGGVAGGLVPAGGQGATEAVAGRAGNA